MRSGKAAGFHTGPEGYGVAVDVTVCEGALDEGGVKLTAEVLLLAPGSDQVIARSSFTARPGRWDGQDAEALALQLGLAAGQLADAVFAMAPAPR